MILKKQMLRNQQNRIVTILKIRILKKIQVN
jgi:hypothetical protein